MNYGFQKPNIDKTNYVSGDGRILGATIINPTGNWEDYLPQYEPQADKYETYGCTVWGMENQLEILHKYLFNKEPNYDERYNYNLAEINPPGTDPQITYETGRKFGFTQGQLPITDTLAEFKTPRPMSDKYKDEGKKWLLQYFYDHDWTLTGGESKKTRLKKLKNDLQYSPLGVSVTAWHEENGVYVDKGQDNNHWCVLYKMDDDFYYVFDSYDHSTKRLPLSHVIMYAKRIVLYKKTVEEQNNTILKNLVNLLQNFYVYLVKNAIKPVGSTVNEILHALYDRPY